jgi:hypothetical protein
MEVVRSSKRPVNSAKPHGVISLKGVLFRKLWMFSQIALRIKFIHNLNIVHYGHQSTLYGLDTDSFVK